VRNLILKIIAQSHKYQILPKLLKKLVNNLESNNLLSCTQFSLRPSKSTEQAVAAVSSYIYNSLKNKKKCATVYLDLAKTFDTIDHKILL